MKLKLRISNILKAGFILIVLVGLIGCATFEPLSIEDRASINSVYIKDTTDGVVYYQKFGATIFQNSDKQPVDEEIMNLFIKDVKGYLVEREIDISEVESDADTLLLIEPFMPDIPYTISMEGVGFLVHDGIGFNTGVLLHTNLRLSLIKAENGNELVKAVVGGIGEETGIKDNPKQWSEYPEEQREKLLEKLFEKLTSETKSKLDEMGL